MRSFLFWLGHNAAGGDDILPVLALAIVVLVIVHREWVVVLRRPIHVFYVGISPDWACDAELWRLRNLAILRNGRY